MRLLFLFPAFFLGHFASAQGLNSEVAFNENYNQTSSGLICVDEFSYLVKSQEYSSSFFTSVELYKIDTLGNILWTAPISPQFSEAIQIYKITASADGGVYVLGFARPTCDILNDCIWFIQKFDATGSVLWTKTWEDQLCFDVTMRGMTLSENGGLFVNYSDAQGSIFYTIDENGITTDSLSVNASNFGKILNFSGFEKIATIQNILYGFDGTGSVLNSRNFIGTIRGTEVQNDSLFLITSDSLFILNSNFQTILQTQIPSFSSYSTLKVDATKIRLVSSNATSQTVLTLNHQLQLIDELSIPVSLPTSARKDFSATHFSANYNHNLTSFNSVRHLDFSLESDVDTTLNSTDIGVIALDPYQVNVGYIQNAPPDFYNVSISANVLVKNFGNKVLNSCRINYFIGPSFVCGFRCYNEEFTNLNLAPNDSVWIDIGTFFDDVILLSGNPFTKEICVYTSHPNRQTDTIVPNDVYCQDVLLGHAGISDETSSKTTLYPNPVQSTLHFNNSIEIPEDFVIFDVSGKVILSGKTLSGAIDVLSLARGMYMIHFKSKDETKSFQLSFVKE